MSRSIIAGFGLLIVSGLQLTFAQAPAGPSQQAPSGPPGAAAAGEIRGKIMEAWGMAMAVVATSVACSGLRYEPGTNLLLADDADLFAEHVVSLLKDSLRRERLGARGRKVVEQYYGWDSSAQELDLLYRHYLGMPRSETLATMAGEEGRA